MTRLAIALCAVFLALAGCDDRDALRRPSPTLARMKDQRRADAYAATHAFPDGRVLRRPPKGTIARDDESEAKPPWSRDLLELGRASYDATCAVCHGVLGDGATYVATKMEKAPPRSLHDPKVRGMTDDALYDVLAHGTGAMPAYADVLSPPARWAVVAYVRALELSQRAAARDLPEPMRRELAMEAP